MKALLSSFYLNGHSLGFLGLTLFCPKPLDRPSLHSTINSATFKYCSEAFKNVVHWIFIYRLLRSTCNWEEIVQKTVQNIFKHFSSKYRHKHDHEDHGITEKKNSSQLLKL